MAVADLVAEFFETELLRAIVAARGIYGTFAGPWSAGTCLNVIMQAASDPNAAGPATFVRGGMGALTQALASAARGFGAEVRTGATVARVVTKDGAAAGVVLSTGEEVLARAVVSNADPKRTLLGLVDPVDLDPDFLHKIGNYRAMGTIAKVHLALNGLPEFSALKGAGAAASGALSGRIHIGPEIDYLERAYDAAKYGDFSPHPYCDVTIPTVTDPSLAPERQARHVGRRAVRPVQAEAATGTRSATPSATPSWTRSPPTRRTSRAQIAHRQVLTPLDLEQTYGLTGGHVLHGEPALDQLFTMRPLLDWAQYRTPVKGLYLCGSGTHPGGGVTGARAPTPRARSQRTCAGARSRRFSGPRVLVSTGAAHAAFQLPSASSRRRFFARASADSRSRRLPVSETPPRGLPHRVAAPAGRAVGVDRHREDVVVGHVLAGARQRRDPPALRAREVEHVLGARRACRSCGRARDGRATQPAERSSAARTCLPVASTVTRLFS